MESGTQSVLVTFSVCVYLANTHPSRTFSVYMVLPNVCVPLLESFATRFGKSTCPSKLPMCYRPKAPLILVRTRTLANCRKVCRSFGVLIYGSPYVRISRIALRKPRCVHLYNDFAHKFEGFPHVPAWIRICLQQFAGPSE